MVGAGIVHNDIRRIGLQCRGDGLPQIEWAVAQTDRIDPAILEGRFGNDSGGVCKIQQPGTLRGMLAHGFADLQRRRDGAQRLGKATHAGGLLPDQPVFRTERDILVPHGSATHAELAQDKCRTAHR